MQTVVTLITAGSLLLHTLVGCCAHGDDGQCACGHGSSASAADAHEHEDHGKSSGCSHSHPIRVAVVPAERDAADDARSDGEPSPHPCQCHCDGNRCLAVASAQAWEIASPQATFDVLPPLCLIATPGANAASRHDARHWSPTALALPLRAHLLHQVLLI